MNTKFIILATVAIIAGVGVAIYVASQNDQDTTPETTSQPQATGPLGEGEQTTEPLAEEAVDADHEVTYTDEGYSPSQITIQAGETVAFINQSERDVWTASNPHPSHTDLPELDAGQAQLPGTAYTYTFDQPGQWGYHNHLNPAQSGVVIVQ